MCRLTTDGRHLANLVREAIALCRAAQERLPSRTGPGRPQEFEQWQLAVLIFVAVAHRRKSKSGQYRFLAQHRELLLEGELAGLLRLERLPSRSTYMGRYGQAHRLYQEAIQLQGRKALAQQVSSAKVVAVDKSLIPAKGPPWHLHQQRAGRRPKGVDDQAAWGRSEHDGWVWGYCYEVVVCATKNRLVFPLLASADKGNRNEHKSFAQKIPHLPKSVRYVLADGGYDGNALGEAIEYDGGGNGKGKEQRRTGRRFLCPLERRGGKPAVGQTIQKGKRERQRRHRAARERFFQSPRGRSLYARRGKTVEPFNQWFKQLFELEHRVWHRGLDNNRTTLLATIFCYQLLLRYSFKTCRRRDGQIQWILDGL